MKRFYTAVAISQTDQGFAVTLDGRELRTPGKARLALASERLASGIAAEWAEQRTEIAPATMPLMKLASTAIDRVAGRMAEVRTETGRYATSDLLCYRAGEPVELVARQQASWQPILGWCASRFDAPLRVATGIVPVEQPPQSLRSLQAAIDALTVMPLTAVADLTASCGSLLLALAVLERRVSAAMAFELATLDERFQAERWGEDEEALIRRNALERDILAAGRFLALL